MENALSAAELIFCNAVLPGAGRAWSGRVCVAVRGERITYVGPQSEAPAGLRGRATEVLDLQGRALLPGLRDSHVHPIMGGLDASGCDLHGAPSLEETLRRVAAFACGRPEAAVVRGAGWSPTYVSGAAGRRDLDAVVRDRPAVLFASDRHSVWVNTRALELAGLDANTPDPVGGRIEREGDGFPSGLLHEWTAMELVAKHLPKPGLAEQREAARQFQDQALALGITAAMEAMAGEEELSAYAALEAEGALVLRLDAALLCAPGHARARVEELTELRRKYQGRRLRPLAAKFFLDGVVEAHTAYLLEPYADRPSTRGEPLWESQALLAAVLGLARQGFQPHFHAIGDAAVRQALDCVAALRQALPGVDTRPAIAHCDLIDDADLPRFRELGIAACLQPAWFCEEPGWAALTRRRLGPARSERLYRAASLERSGARLVCGSDWPAGGAEVSLSPWHALAVGATRQAHAEAPAHRPEERLSLPSLLAGYTTAGAYAALAEHERGLIAPGFLADLVVVEPDPLSVTPHRLPECRVLYARVGSRTVVRDEALG